jgi:16S rRNA (adenine1518-N6/adenine1519-N6)-dimethyltransferase
VLVQLACERTGTHRVSRAVFVPPPNVDSLLVGFRRSPAWPELEPRWERIARLVHAGFGTRRKTLANALEIAGFAARNEVEQALAAHRIDARVRAEALPPAAFVALEALI